MKKHVAMAALAAVVSLGAASIAQAQLAYSFETGSPGNLDGFGPNGGGVTVAQDTVGTTHGSNSMRYSVVTGATFVGALTGNVAPVINDPPGVNAILFDMTIQQAFTGGFAVIGVTVFGASQPDFPGGQQFGLQAQFADFEHIGGKAPGTYNDIRIDLNSATHPLTFNTGQSFNDIFGVVGSGQNDVIPTGFQLFLNKSNDQAVTVFIDNIRVVVPEPTSMALLGSFAGAGLLARRRRA